MASIVENIIGNKALQNRGAVHHGDSRNANIVLQGNFFAYKFPSFCPFD
jgi:hypothetical protein